MGEGWGWGEGEGEGWVRAWEVRGGATVRTW